MIDMKRILPLEFEILMKAGKSRAKTIREKIAFDTGNGRGASSERYAFDIPHGKESMTYLYLLRDRIDGAEECAMHSGSLPALDLINASGLDSANLETAATARPNIVDPVTFVASAPSPFGSIAFGALPSGSPTQSIIPGRDFADNYLNNVWWLEPGAAAGQRKWWGFDGNGWGRIVANIAPVEGVYFASNAGFFFQVPAGSYSFATLGFEVNFDPNFNSYNGEVPVRLKVADYSHAQFDTTELYVLSGWEKDGANGYADPIPEDVIDEADIVIPWMDGNGEGHLFDGAGNVVNLAPVVSAGGTFYFKFEQTDDSFEYYRDYSRCFLHLWA